MDWRVKENSNMTYSLQGLNVHITQKVVSNYWLNSIYPREIREAHLEGHFHIHDIGTLGPYCVGWDLQDLLVVGFTGVRGKVESHPAKHFDVALMRLSKQLQIRYNRVLALLKLGMFVEARREIETIEQLEPAKNPVYAPQLRKLLPSQ